MEFFFKKFNGLYFLNAPVSVTTVFYTIKIELYNISLYRIKYL